MFHEGYMKVEKVVDIKQLVEIQRLLHHTLGLPQQIIPGGIQKEGLGKFQGHLSNSPDIVKIIEGNVDMILRAIFQPYDYERHNMNVQVAFRFPELNKQQQDSEFIGEGR